tara:strand:+ start:314 stop:556 length:243 start_codon:yes stop_codon:yes gene_type:complete
MQAGNKPLMTVRTFACKDIDDRYGADVDLFPRLMDMVGDRIEAATTGAATPAATWPCSTSAQTEALHGYFSSDRAAARRQ